jgi:hypothetical protein
MFVRYSLLLVLFTIAACDDGPSGPDFSGVVLGDMSHKDLEQSSIFCSQTCQAPAACCITPTTSGGWQATCANSCPDGGVFTQCTGPSDCSPQAPDCCVTINLTGDMDASIMSSGGAASCTATCPAGLSNGNTLFHTILCHVPGDCSGYSGDFGAGNESFDGCCSSPLAPALHFCAPSRLSGNNGLTC